VRRRAIEEDATLCARPNLSSVLCVFDRAIKGIEVEDIEARVAQLERAAEEATQRC